MNNYDDIKRFKEKLNMEAIDYKEIAENNPNSSASSWTIIKQIVNADKPFHPLEQGHSTLPSPAPISQQEFSARPAASDVAPAPLPSANAAAGPAYGPSVLSPLFNAVEKAMPPQPATGAPPFRAIDGGSRATGPGSVFDQLTQRAASAPGTSGATPTPLPTAGGASALQGHAALMAAPPKPGQSTDGPGKTLVESPFAQPQAPGRASGVLPPQGNPFTTPNAAPTSSPFAQAQGREPAQDVAGMRFKNLFNRSPAALADTAVGRDIPLSLLLENIALCR
ncbi:hypothetical protein Sant_0181 [Sodalis praecaptivus]|uniref:Cellulose biosynthesis protein BcsO n=1 Tax=Sodalis praecaptivus TaxID=1239307 RepID=W0HRW9_9GAMM|nr:cellulose biosynthesis protein BcsO [Sodalis praecaptivus]AHF75297.1 hypothetical protein Sant_0181 [Sodalis praecaptivus]